VAIKRSRPSWRSACSASAVHASAMVSSIGVDSERILLLSSMQSLARLRYSEAWSITAPSCSLDCMMVQSVRLGVGTLPDSNVNFSKTGHRGFKTGHYLNGGKWRIVGEDAEVESGRRSDRPQLDRALPAARVHHVPVVVAKVDRLTRSVAFLSRLLEAGVDIRFAATGRFSCSKWPPSPSWRQGRPASARRMRWLQPRSGARSSVAIAG
jgi:hypothetical protein